jgi:hypothetical protein
MPGLQQEGFAIFPGVFDRREVDSLLGALSVIDAANGVASHGGCTRSQSAASGARGRPVDAIGRDPRDCRRAPGPGEFPVRGTLFETTVGANWLVTWHQDRTICVAARREVPGYDAWTRKAGVWHIQPPACVLEGCSVQIIRIFLLFRPVRRCKGFTIGTVDQLVDSAENHLARSAGSSIGGIELRYQRSTLRGRLAEIP